MNRRPYSVVGIVCIAFCLMLLAPGTHAQNDDANAPAYPDGVPLHIVEEAMQLEADSLRLDDEWPADDSKLKK